jgi:biotin carboxylase
MKEYVIIIGGGALTMPAYRIARDELGLGIIAMDWDPNTPGMRYADRAVEVSTKDVEGAARAAKAVAAEVPIIGVFTCGADVEVTVAAVAEALDLPGVSFEVARRCNDKVLMHRHLDAKDFAGKPRYRIVYSSADACSAADEVGFPCVVKPVDNCASRGVQRVDNPSDVAEAYGLAAGFNIDKSTGVLVEECLVGTKHTIEMIAYAGEWHLLSLIDTHYISPRWPCETGLNTTRLSLEDQTRVFDFAVAAARAVGIDHGAHKVDVNLDAEGRIGLIELTARLSGGFHCQYASPLAFGSHDIRAALKLAIGRSLDLEDIRHQWERGAAVRAVFPPPGRIVSITGEDEARSVPGVKEVFIWKGVGDIVGPYRNSADRFAFLIADGSTTEEAVANAEKGVAAINIETELVEESSA